MKDLIVYYFAIVLPLPLIYLFAINRMYNLFGIFLFIYLIYRGIIDGRRLINKGLIDSSQHWKAFIPLWTSQYFKELYFEK